MPERTAGGFRDYPDWAVNLVRFIKQAQDLGFALADVEGLLRLADGGEASCAQARAITAERLADLDRRIANLHRMRRRLAEMASVCEGPGPGRFCRVMVQTAEAVDPTNSEPEPGLCTCPATAVSLT